MTHEQGYRLGFEDGYEKGAQDGRIQGYDRGCRDGRDEEFKLQRLSGSVNVNISPHRRRAAGDLLRFLAQRLVSVYGESPTVDFIQGAHEYADELEQDSR